MDTTPADGQQVTYIEDDRTFTCTSDTAQFGWRQAVRAAHDGEDFWLLVEYCEPVGGGTP